MKAWRMIVGLLAMISLGLWACDGHRSSADKTTVSKVESKDGKVPRVVVKPFGAKGISEDEASGLASKFCVELSKSEKYDLLCAEDLRALFSHQAGLLKLGQCESEDCLADLGEKTKADLIMHVIISKVGEKFMVSANVVDGPSGTIKSRLAHEVDSGAIEDLLDAMAPLACKVKELL